MLLPFDQPYDSYEPVRCILWANGRASSLMPGPAVHTIEITPK